MKTPLSLREFMTNVALCGLLAGSAVVWGSLALRAVAFRFPLDYGEAHMLDQAMRFLDGQNIYRRDISSPPYSIANYPPLMVAIMAPLVKLFGPVFWWGRLFCVLCALSTALFLGLLVYRFTNDRFSSLVTGLLFLATPHVIFWSPFVRVDILALAFSIAGLFTLSHEPLGKWQFGCGVLLLVAAAFTKQSYLLAAPLASFCWLWQSSRKHALIFPALIGGVILLMASLLNIVTDGGFFFHVVEANIHAFSLERLVGEWRALVTAAGISLCLGILFVTYPWSFRSWPLFAPFLLGAFLTSLTVGKLGSSFNYFLELDAALALASGQLLAWSRVQPSIRIRLAIMVCLIVQSGLYMKVTNDSVRPYFQGRFNKYRDLLLLEEMVGKANGPILGDEYIGLATLQGKPLYIEPFIATQMARTRLWDQAQLLRDIDDHKFPLILLLHPINRERWTNEMIDAIHRSYRVDETVGNVRVFKPRA